MLCCVDCRKISTMTTSRRTRERDEMMRNENNKHDRVRVTDRHGQTDRQTSHRHYTLHRERYLLWLRVGGREKETRWRETKTTNTTEYVSQTDRQTDIYRCTYVISTNIVMWLEHVVSQKVILQTVITAIQDALLVWSTVVINRTGSQSQAQHWYITIYTVSQKKLCQCYFLNNSVKHWPTFTIFGVQHHKQARCKWL